MTLQGSHVWCICVVYLDTFDVKLFKCFSFRCHYLPPGVMTESKYLIKCRFKKIFSLQFCVLSFLLHWFDDWLMLTCSNVFFSGAINCLLVWWLTIWIFNKMQIKKIFSLQFCVLLSLLLHWFYHLSEMIKRLYLFVLFQVLYKRHRQRYYFFLYMI